MTRKKMSAWHSNFSRCCCCSPNESIIIARSNTQGTWDISTYKNQKFRKYKNKYWDIVEFYSRGESNTVLAKGRLSSNGDLIEFPDNVTISEDMIGEIIVRCYPICGDPDYYGEVIATNIGIPGIWDLSFLNDMIAPKSVWNGYWSIRSCRYQYNVRNYRISETGKFLDVPTPEQIYVTNVSNAVNMPFRETDHAVYCEVVVHCTSYSLGFVNFGTGNSLPQIIDIDTAKSLYNNYHDIAGTATLRR